MKKALKRLDGVQDVTVSLEAQSARVVLRPGEPLDPKKLREAVKKADFTAGQIHVTVTGDVVDNPDKETSTMADLALKIPDSAQILLLVAPPPGEPDTKHDAPRTKDLLAGLRKAFKAGTTRFTITGRVHAHKDAPLGLTVEQFDIVAESDDQ